ncbi:MAG: hypothetical protein H2045_09180 [Rhizobiales bacterium]|nr:hypothetical protein [Hyphomicrobiales bacterium]
MDDLIAVSVRLPNGRLVKRAALIDIPAIRAISIDLGLGHIAVEHDGHLKWDDLQVIKANVWGEDAAAIEIYPPASEVINNRSIRHLWLLGPDDWWPNLTHEGTAQAKTLRERFHQEAQK